MKEFQDKVQELVTALEEKKPDAYIIGYLQSLLASMLYCHTSNKDEVMASLDYHISSIKERNENE